MSKYNNKQRKALPLSLANRNSTNSTSDPNTTSNSNMTNNEVVNTSNEEKSSDDEQINNRGQWSNKLDFMMSCVGYAVGLGNLWRFPYLCYKNGGGVFLIQYLICLVFSGLPVFLLETTLGQLLGEGVLSIWHISPILKGVGFSTVIITFWMNTYYIVIITWSLYYLVRSFALEVPWGSCNNSWNTIDCRSDDDVNKLCIESLQNKSKSVNSSDYEQLMNNCTRDFNFSNPVVEFWEREVLHMSPSINEIGGIQVPLAICLIVTWIMCYYTIYKGIRMTGKITYFTALFPYLCMLILFIRGATLDGALIGIKYYFQPNMEKFLDANVWNDAATQIYYSYGLGLGAWIALSSYNKYSNNVLKDTLIITAINCTTAIFSGAIVFCIIGFMAKQQNKPIEKVASSGSGLTFLAYPAAVLKMPFSPIWAVLFFVMLLVLGFGSQFVQLESFFTALIDEFPHVLRNRRQIFITYMITLSTIIGFVFVTESGFYWFELFNFYAASGFALLFLIFFEVVAISWLYGVDRYILKVENMLQRKISIFWKICWTYISPLVCLVIFICSLIQYKPLEYKDYVYPNWSIDFGWFLALSSMICVPFYAIYKLYKTPGTLKEKWEKLRTDHDAVDQIIQNRSHMEQIKN